jgi:hypothetical protein
MRPHGGSSLTQAAQSRNRATRAEPFVDCSTTTCPAVTRVGILPSGEYDVLLIH